jgi:hypothetical protein
MQIWRGIFLAWVIAMTSLSAFAGTVHEVRFKQSHRILVWQNGALLGDGQRIPLIETQAVETLGSGQLSPIGLSNTQERQTARFEIASNTAFALETSDPSAAAAVRVRVIKAGANAQVRPIPTNAQSNAVFVQGEKTAIQRGTPESQTLTLEVSWSSEQVPELWVRALDT